MRGFAGLVALVALAALPSLATPFAGDAPGHDDDASPAADSSAADADTTEDVEAVVPAGAAGADTSVRVTGTPLRFGWGLDRLSQFGSFTAIKSTVRGEAAREGALRWFGIDAKAKLALKRGRLVRVVIEVPKPSSRHLDYVNDELTRRGFHRGCAERSRVRSDCSWKRDTDVRLTCSASAMNATIVPHVETASPARAVAPAVAASQRREPLVLPDTLVLARPDAPASRLAPPFVERVQPQFPDAAREAGVQGNVWVRALVDTNGRVIEAAVFRGIPELNDAALAAARASRFEPYVKDGVTYRFRVEMPFRFTVH